MSWCPNHNSLSHDFLEMTKYTHTHRQSHTNVTKASNHCFQLKIMNVQCVAPLTFPIMPFLSCREKSSWIAKKFGPETHGVQGTNLNDVFDPLTFSLTLPWGQSLNLPSTLVYDQLQLYALLVECSITVRSSTLFQLHTWYGQIKERSVVKFNR